MQCKSFFFFSSHATEPRVEYFANIGADREWKTKITVHNDSSNVALYAPGGRCCSLLNKIVFFIRGCSFELAHTFFPPPRGDKTPLINHTEQLSKDFVECFIESYRFTSEGSNGLLRWLAKGAQVDEQDKWHREGKKEEPANRLKRHPANTIKIKA